MGEQRPTARAVRECAEWSYYCLTIGWPKSSLDELEALWWKYHDEFGRIKQPNPETESEGK